MSDNDQDNKNFKHGWFSREAYLSMGGKTRIRHPDGKEVLTTAIYKDPEAKSYLWEDKIYVGLVGSEFVKEDYPTIESQIHRDLKELARKLHSYNFI